MSINSGIGILAMELGRKPRGGTLEVSMTGQISVIIPYYQEEPGILREAVTSAISQEGVADLEIIVVDDGSPAPACQEVSGLAVPSHVTLKVIEQPNRGPGAARNRALDHVRSGTAYVAFLDSDDRWTSDHLRNAICTLDAGYDLYFADQLDNERCYIGDLQNGVPGERVEAYSNLFRYMGQASFEVNLCPTSTAVYRYERFSEMRFPEIASIGEDRVFWMIFTRQTDRIVFSSNVECTSGPGIHIYENSGWGTPRAIWQLYQWILLRKWLRNNFDLRTPEAEENDSRIKQLRRDFVAALLHETRRFRILSNRTAISFLRNDPAAFLAVPLVSAEILARRLMCWCFGRGGTPDDERSRGISRSWRPQLSAQADSDPDAAVSRPNTSNSRLD